MLSFHFSLADIESNELMSELKDPVANEKEVTPRSIMKIQNNFSQVVFAVISPYPTVAIVVTTK